VIISWRILSIGPPCTESAWYTSDVEYHELVSSRGTGQVAAIDSSVLASCPSNDEHGQGAVVRSVDPIAAIVYRHVFAGRNSNDPRFRRRRSTGTSAA